MTTLAARPARPQFLRQLRSERIKLSSTKTWWLFGIGTVVMTGLALLINCLTTNDDLSHGAHADLVTDQANVFTSGQYFGGLFVLLLSILMVTNEFYHQTATSTFLATPRRTQVIVGKFAMAMAAAAFAWLLTTIIDIVVGVIFFNSQGVSNGLGTAHVVQAIVLNLMVFALWGVFGIGFAALIRSQIGATVTAALLYTIGSFAVQVIFYLIWRYVWHSIHAFELTVLLPATAAQVAISPLGTHIETPSTTPDGATQSATIAWWVGVLVMLAYGAILGGIGTSILRKRDIS